MDIPVRRSNLQQFSISDFIQWHRQKELILNPSFQRRPVWTIDARSYLIDTILLGFPIPKIYLRTTIDTRTLRALRDVVDGQQRLRAIIDFGNNELTVNRRSKQFRGMRYNDLDLGLQEAFLSYQIGVEHLINADDSTVLEVFSRLNSYTLPLNAAEQRHAAYNSELKWLVSGLAGDLRWFLERYNVLTLRTMVRMEDDTFFAELINILTYGIVDGGASALDKLYRRFPEDFPDADRADRIIREAIEWMDNTLHELLQAPPLNRAYQLHMLFAAYVHQSHQLPAGRMTEMPIQSGIASTEVIIRRLSALAQAVEDDDIDGPFREFIAASSGATTRFKSRAVRFRAFNRAIAAQYFNG